MSALIPITSTTEYVPPKLISKALQSNRNNEFLEKNTYRNKRWVCFDPINKEYDTPKSQLLALEAKEFIEPIIPNDYFYKFEINHLRKYKTNDDTTRTPTSNTNPTPAPTAPTNPTNRTVHSPTPTSSTTNSNNTSTPSSTYTNVPSTEPSPISNTTNNNTSTLPSTNSNVTQPPTNTNSGSPPTATSTTPSANKKSRVHTIPTTHGDGMSTGMVIMDIDTMDRFTTDVVERHAHDCPDGSLKVVSNEKHGYELDRCFLHSCQSTIRDQTRDSFVKTFVIIALEGT